MMEFRILGCLEAGSGGMLVRLGGPREQRLLAALLLEAGRVVPLPRLAEVVWQDDPPATAAKQIRNAASRLRGLLAGAGAGELLVTHPAGYRLAVTPGAVDAGVFETSVARAQRAVSAGEVTEAAGLLRSALDLWRGPALAGLEGRVFESAAAVWEERRWEAAELLYDCQLAAGRHRDVIADLRALTAGHPLRDKPAGQLMLALYRSGRQAEALAVYDRTRAVLAAELGLDPGPELRRLRQQILTCDPALAPPAGRQAPGGQARAQSGPAAGGAGPVAPRQLPAMAGPFAGRAAELAALRGLLDRAGDEAGMVVISAIGGMAGIGKTALALRFAHEVAARFPDGQIYLNLHGFDPSAPPVRPGAAVRSLLDALDVAPARIPAGLDAQAALYRSLLAGRRMLLVLDNARDAGQVLPLLPGTPGCLILVTSRHQLTSLAISHGAHPVSLDVLTPAEAGDLLSARLGSARTAAEPAATAGIISGCAGLPLALAIMAARAVARPDLPLGALAAQLRDSRLGALAAGNDPATDLRVVFSVSYGALSPGAARLFRLLGLHPSAGVSVPAAASLAGRPAAEVRVLLAELAQAYLVSETGPGRYACHDLVLAYAAGLASQAGSEERQAATRRMLDHYLHTAHAADRLLNPDRDSITLAPPEPGAGPQPPADHGEALAWFSAERAVLLATVDQAAHAGFDTRAWQLAWAVRTFLDRRGHWDDQAVTQRAALAAARRLRDPRAQSRAHLFLGEACMELGRFDDARTHYRHCLTLCGQAGDQAGQGLAHHSLALLSGRQDRHAEALEHAQQALRLYRAAGYRRGQARALNNAGWWHVQLGHHARALACCQQALALHRELRDQHGQASTWDTLGYIRHRLGHHATATTCYQHALDLVRDAGVRDGEAIVLTHLGDAHHAAGDPGAARAAWQRALAIHEELGQPQAGEIRRKLAGLDQPVP